MAFKKIAPPPVKEKPKERPKFKDYVIPNDYQCITESKLRPDVVKWDNPGCQTQEDGSFVKGHVWAVDSWDVFGSNQFILLFNKDQTTERMKQGILKVWHLNEDLSPKLDDKGNPMFLPISKWRLFHHVCYAIGNFDL